MTWKRLRIFCCSVVKDRFAGRGRSGMKHSYGFAPIAAANARVLILGSLPGQRSLAEQEYYAHPQNAFWRIMADLHGISGAYETRCAGLIERRIALWDVLYGSVRPGSLDADIRQQTAVANPLKDFLHEHPSIRQILFNGKKSESLFRKLVPIEGLEEIRLIGLPSTSPAYAAMPYDKKLAAWREALLTS